MVVIPDHEGLDDKCKLGINSIMTSSAWAAKLRPLLLGISTVVDRL